MGQNTSYYPELKKEIKPASGKLGVLLPGLGAVSTTLIAGVLLSLKKLSRPIGSLTQMSRIRLGKRDQAKYPLIKEFVPLADLKDLSFCGWDIYNENCYQSAIDAGVLSESMIRPIKDEMSAIQPLPAVFNQSFIKNLSGPNVKNETNKMKQAEALMNDMASFKKENNLDRLVMCWCGSTEAYRNQAQNKIFQSLDHFEKALKESHEEIPPSMIYAYAALQMGVAYANGAPNLSCDVPAMVELAKLKKVPIAGKDFKTGQTLMKTIVAPGLKARMLGLDGWFSGNILGNRDGEVLDDPDSFRSKEVTKSSVLDSILNPELYPDLYKDYFHKIRIEYYPPRGDAKEGWDNIDIRGWMDQPMQIKINFLCRDSILAAPVVLDLILFLDLAQRAGMYGMQEWLSFYFKSPMCRPDLKPENDLFIQNEKLRNTLRIMMGEEVIDHSGLDYYEN